MSPGFCDTVFGERVPVTDQGEIPILRVAVVAVPVDETIIIIVGGGEAVIVQIAFRRVILIFRPRQRDRSDLQIRTNAGNSHRASRCCYFVSVYAKTER